MDPEKNVHRPQCEAQFQWHEKPDGKTVSLVGMEGETRGLNDPTCLNLYSLRACLPVETKAGQLLIWGLILDSHSGFGFVRPSLSDSEWLLVILPSAGHRNWCCMQMNLITHCPERQIGNLSLKKFQAISIFECIYLSSRYFIYLLIYFDLLPRIREIE